MIVTSFITFSHPTWEAYYRLNVTHYTTLSKNSVGRVRQRRRNLQGKESTSQQSPLAHTTLYTLRDVDLKWLILQQEKDFLILAYLIWNLWSLTIIVSFHATWLHYVARCFMFYCILHGKIRSQCFTYMNSVICRLKLLSGLQKDFSKYTWLHFF